VCDNLHITIAQDKLKPAHLLAKLEATAAKHLFHTHAKAHTRLQGSHLMTSLGLVSIAIMVS
jgi:hypothetical protein